MVLDKKLSIWVLLASILTLSFSALGYFLPTVGNLFFAVILILVFIASIYSLRLGLMIALVELFVGSMGYLFGVSLGGFNLSARIAIFLVIMLVWLVGAVTELIKKKRLENYGQIFRSDFFKYYLVLILVIFWGALWGYLRGNGLANVFFDFNGWLFFFYALPFFNAFSAKDSSKILSVMAGAITANCLLSVFVFVAFTQNFSFVDSLYSWLRDWRLGEITFAGGNLWRVFLQSQIYAAIGTPIFFYLAAKKYLESKKVDWLPVLAFIFSSLTVVLSLSRSFWLGCLAAFGVMLLIFLFKEKIGLKKIFIFVFSLIAIVALEVLFVWLVAGSGSGDLISKRLTDTSEAAGISRINQLQPLSLGITRHPILGSGFGTTITYQTRDPRILKNNPDGWYTTFTFEWGYLDILLKVGLLGLAVYLSLIWKVAKQLRITNYELQIGLLLGLVVLLVVHIFSPYLNHPLGIGYIVLLGCLAKKEDYLSSGLLPRK